MLAAVVAAQTPTPLTLNVNRELKIIASYPLEMKYGSWVRIILDVTSMANVTLNDMRVRVVFVHENGVVTLFEGSVIQGKYMPPGYQVQRALEFQVAIPAPRPPVEPFLEMYIVVDYSVDGLARYYEFKAPISIVARATYSELTAALAQAQEKARLADDLSQRVRDLELKLANATGACKVLAEQVAKLSAENNELKLQLGSLRAANTSLSSRVSQLEIENALLKNELASLREEKGSLSSKLVSVESSYSALTGELNSLRQKYEALLAEASNLRVAFAAAAVVALTLAALLALYFRAGRKPMRGAPPPFNPSSGNRPVEQTSLEDPPTPQKDLSSDPPPLTYNFIILD